MAIKRKIVSYEQLELASHVQEEEPYHSMSEAFQDGMDSFEELQKVAIRNQEFAKEKALNNLDEAFLYEMNQKQEEKDCILEEMQAVIQSERALGEELCEKGTHLCRRFHFLKAGIGRITLANNIDFWRECYDEVLYCTFCKKIVMARHIEHSVLEAPLDRFMPFLGEMQKASAEDFTLISRRSNIAKVISIYPLPYVNKEYVFNRFDVPDTTDTVQKLHLSLSRPWDFSTRIEKIDREMERIKVKYRSYYRSINEQEAK